MTNRCRDVLKAPKGEQREIREPIETAVYYPLFYNSNTSHLASYFSKRCLTIKKTVS